MKNQKTWRALRRLKAGSALLIYLNPNFRKNINQKGGWSPTLSLQNNAKKEIRLNLIRNISSK
jgi:hypothetical protein